MKILIDNADIQEIKKAYEYFPITGVTSDNPEKNRKKSIRCIEGNS